MGCPAQAATSVATAKIMKDRIRFLLLHEGNGIT
jgi:hypothetical protein